MGAEFDLVLKGARVITPEAEIVGGVVAVKDGRIAAVEGPASKAAGAKELDLRGRILFPGMFDPHCHLGSGDERSWDYMARSFAQDTKDCLIGGVTSIATTTVLMPDPLPENFRHTIEAGNGRSHVDYRVTSVVLSRDHVKQIPEIVRLGGLSFKFYCGYCLDLAEKMGMNREGVPTDMFYEACEQAASTGAPVMMMIHAEEPHVRRLLASRLRAQGREDLVAWAQHSPQWSEAVQVLQYGVITKDFGLPLYVVHISRAPTIDLIEYLSSTGMPIIAETLACFLSSTAQENEERGCGIKAKIQPPIRFAEDRDRLWKGIASGTITAIGTDTIPYTSKYKGKTPFWEARPGLNIQTIDTLPLLLTEGYHKGKVDLRTLARLLCENPARYFGAAPRKGRIAAGADADLVVIDPDKEATLGLHRMRGGSDYSIWEGKKVRGLPVMTFLRGKLVMKDGEIVGEPTGRCLGRGGEEGPRP